MRTCQRRLRISHDETRGTKFLTKPIRTKLKLLQYESYHGAELINWLRDHRGKESQTHGGHFITTSSLTFTGHEIGHTGHSHSHLSITTVNHTCQSHESHTHTQPPHHMSHPSSCHTTPRPARNPTAQSGRAGPGGTLLLTADLPTPLGAAPRPAPRPAPYPSPSRARPVKDLRREVVPLLFYSAGCERDKR